jgi:hypothetical protein
MRLEEEEAMEREERAKWMAEKLGPELKEMAAAVEKRPKRKMKNKPISDALKAVLGKVEATEHMIRRNDRSLIYLDIKNRIRKESMERK